MANITIKANKPVAYSITVPNGKNVWDALAQFEIRAQLRADENRASRLIANLHTYMTPSFSGNNIVITWTMTGAQTRALYDLVWGNGKTGFVTIVISDVGGDDTKALVFPTLQVAIIDITTNGTGDT